MTATPRPLVRRLVPNCLRTSGSRRLVNPGEVVMHEVKGDSGLVVVHLRRNPQPRNGLVFRGRSEPGSRADALIVTGPKMGGRSRAPKYALPGVVTVAWHSRSIGKALDAWAIVQAIRERAIPACAKEL